MRYRLLGSLEVLLRPGGRYPSQLERLIDHLRGALGPAAYEAARSAGQALTVTEIATAALADRT